jgi:hypothetical protein
MTGKNNVHTLICPTVPYTWKSARLCLTVSRLRPFVLPKIVVLIRRRICSITERAVKGGNWSTGRKICPSVILPTTDPTLTGLGPNPDLLGDRPRLNGWAMARATASYVGFVHGCFADTTHSKHNAPVLQRQIGSGSLGNQLLSLATIKRSDQNALILVLTAVQYSWQLKMCLL